MREKQKGRKSKILESIGHKKANPQKDASEESDRTTSVQAGGRTSSATMPLCFSSTMSQMI
jgi:hypothetical protein